MSPDTSLPHLVAGLGNTLVDVREHSTRQISNRLHGQVSDSDLVAIDKPLQFVFAGPHPFELPPTRFASLECTAAVVTAMQTSPHLDYLPEAAALELLGQLAERIERAGWLVDHDERPVPSPAELGRSLRDPARPDDTWWFAGIYRSGDARLYVKLRRTHRAGREQAGSGGQFLVTLQWRDDVLLDRSTAVAKQLRRQYGLPTDVDRPIGLDAYVERVRSAMGRAG